MTYKPGDFVWVDENGFSCAVAWGNEGPPSFIKNCTRIHSLTFKASSTHRLIKGSVQKSVQTLLNGMKLTRTLYCVFPYLNLISETLDSEN